MKPIQMVDLHSQYLNIKKDIDAAIAGVLDSSDFVKGNEIKLFEDELASYLGIKNVIGCANGTDALQVALMSLDLKPGDEVITPDFTFISTLEVVALLQMKPLIVDVDEQTFLLDIKDLEKKITSKTKAIIPVHLFGQCCPIDEIMEIAAKYNIFIIEDAAQSIGATYQGKKEDKKSGTIGHIGCTSFFPTKNLACFGDGGALFTNDDVLAEKIRMIVNHGMKVRYHYDFVGVNSRLDTLQAAILRIKLKHLDQYNQARQKVAAFYDKELAGISDISIPAKVNNSNHVYHQYTLQIKNGQRDKLKKYLEEKNIPAMIYYPVPLHLQKAFSSLGYKKGDFPVSERVCNDVLSIPMHTELDEEQLNYITQTIKGYFHG